MAWIAPPVLSVPEKLNQRHILESSNGMQKYLLV